METAAPAFPEPSPARDFPQSLQVLSHLVYRSRDRFKISLTVPDESLLGIMKVGSSFAVISFLHHPHGLAKQIELVLVWILRNQELMPDNGANHVCRQAPSC